MWRADQQAEWKGRSHSVRQRRIHSHPRRPPDAHKHIALQVFIFCRGEGRFIHQIDKRIMKFMQVEKIRKKKATHGSAVQASLVFECSDMNKSRKIQPFISGQVFGEHTLPLRGILHFPGCCANAPREEWEMGQMTSLLTDSEETETGGIKPREVSVFNNESMGFRSTFRWSAVILLWDALTAQTITDVIPSLSCFHSWQMKLCRWTAAFVLQVGLGFEVFICEFWEACYSCKCNLNLQFSTS